MATHINLLLFTFFAIVCVASVAGNKLGSKLVM